LQRLYIHFTVILKELFGNNWKIRNVFVEHFAHIIAHDDKWEGSRARKGQRGSARAMHGMAGAGAIGRAERPRGQGEHGESRGRVGRWSGAG